ncbi:hypothetical protein BC628DRAFT_1424019 [Trametes gibbosa]|nr:hypothetical protein BC628DRAFT_1424019 [Trametes gibbosa]
MWGKYVGRAINRTHVADLQKSFLEGIENNRDPIACVVDEEWIDPKSVYPEGTCPEDIKTLWFTISVFNAVIEMCGGGHRVDGLRENPTMKAYQTQVEREKRIGTLKERIRTTGYWLVKLYRHEGFTQVMGLHVSKNEDKPNQHQDVMEHLLDWIAKVVVHMSELKDPPCIGSEEWMTDVLAQLWGKEHRNNYGCEFKVLNSPYMFTFCREVSQFVYLRDGDKVKPTQLFTLSDVKGMGGGHMWMLAIQSWLREMRWIAMPHEEEEDRIEGVMSAFALVNKWRRARVDTDDELQASLVKKEANLSHWSWHVERLEEWATMLEETSAAPEMDAVWTKELMESIDSIYLKEAMERYDAQVSSVVAEVWTKAVDGGGTGGAYTERQLDALDCAETWYLWLQDVLDVSPWDRFPYPTGSFIADLHRSIGELADAFRFMLRIVDPMCDSRILIKNTGLVDHSTCILHMLNDPTISMLSRYTLWEFPQFIFFMMGELRDGVLGFLTAKWASLNNKHCEKKAWLPEVEPFLQHWLLKNGKPPVEYVEADKLAKRFSQHYVWLHERNEQITAENDAAACKARGRATTQQRATGKAKTSKSGDNALEAAQMTPESTVNIKYALLVLRNSKEFFNVNRSTSYRNMHGLGLQVRAMWDIIGNIHGPIYAQDAGNELRSQLLLYFNAFSTVNPTQVFTLEKMTTLKCRTQFNNWDEQHFDKIVENSEWFGFDLKRDIGASDTFFAHQQRINNYRKEIDAVISKVASLSSAMHDPYTAQTSGDSEHVGFRMAALVAEPFKNFIAALVANTSRLEAHLQAPELAPIVLQNESLTFDLRGMTDNPPEDTTAHVNLDSFKFADPKAYNEYVARVVEKHSAKAAKRPMKFAYPQDFAEELVKNRSEAVGSTKPALSKGKGTAPPPKGPSPVMEEEEEPKPSAPRRGAQFDLVLPTSLQTRWETSTPVFGAWSSALLSPTVSLGFPMQPPYPPTQPHPMLPPSPPEPCGVQEGTQLLTT